MNTEQRLTDLESALAEYIKYNTLAQQRFESEFAQFRDEMRAFKDEIQRDTQAFKNEMRAFKDEMLAFKDEMRAFKDEIQRDTQAFKNEMRAFKDEMRAFKDEIQRDTQAFKNEMRAFKDEMLAFKDEMRAFKDEIQRDTQAFKNEMRAFKDEIQRDTQAFKNEMRAFKDEMQEFKNRIENNIKENNKQWGALANKLGTIVEDLIFPASRPVIESVFGITIQQIGMRIIRQSPKMKEEFDVIALSEKQVFLIEVKSTPRFDYLNDFVERKISIFHELFPEYASLRLVPIFASISIPDDFIRAATKRGIFVMAYRAWEYMDILNAKELLSQS